MISLTVIGVTGKIAKASALPPYAGCRRTRWSLR
jgi:hypothetical protein